MIPMTLCDPDLPPPQSEIAGLNNKNKRTRKFVKFLIALDWIMLEIMEKSSVPLS